jgi:hypothetical protein
MATKMAIKIAIKIAINRVASMSVSSEECTPSKVRTGHPGAVQSKNTINADLGHYQPSNRLANCAVSA